MLHRYECNKCGSTVMVEGEMWESCPICEETPTERDLRERAEKAEAERDRLREALKEAVPPTDDWWCPACQESLPPSRVTYYECCDDCGTYLGYQDTEWIEKARQALEGDE